MALGNFTIEITDNSKSVLNSLDDAKKKALAICGIEAVTYAKKICPVDTGRLRASISYLVTDSNTAIVGTNVEYASDVELGTSRQKAQPYLEPAIANHTDEYKKIVKSVLGG